MATYQANQIRNAGYLRPQREWGWQIAVYLYLAGIGAGSFMVGLAMDWWAHTPYPSRAILLWGPLLVAIGAPFLILDLGIKTRFLKACLNPKTSWISRGFLILSAFIIVGLAVWGMSLVSLVGISDEPTSLLALDVLGFILALATAAYAGVLLQSLKYIPFWNTPLLPLLFLVSALSTGAMLVILSALGYGLLVPHQQFHPQLMDVLVPTEQILILIEGVILGLYLLSTYRTREQGRSSVRLLVSGNLKLVFWLGIIVSGFFFPIVLEAVYSRLPEYPFLLFLSGFFLLAGGFFLRYGILSAGIKEQHPLHKWIEMQDSARTRKKTQV